jgi:predicted Mrr-cat superfamily restriction endonuclease
MTSTAGPRRAWLNRAGHGAEHVDAYVRRGVITLGWARIRGLDDLRELDPDQIEHLIVASGVRKFPGMDAGELLSFRDGMQVGDVVVTPDPKRKAVLFGDITGAYEFQPEYVVGDHRHLRSVRWIGRWPRYDLEPPLRKTLDDYQRTVLRLSNQDDWLAVADSIRAGDGMPIAQKPPRKVRAPSTPRAPKAPRPAPARVTPPRMCPSCQLVQAPSMFDEASDVCRDCA